ncbi:MAG: sulfatase [Planctomycetaceae bacterium]
MRFLLALSVCLPAFSAAAAERPNILLITVDDMNWDSVGIYGCPIRNITPNIDRLAGEGLRFEHAHVTIAICQPTRAVWMTGRYPHNSGALGFNPIRPGVPTLVERLREAGYQTGLMAKHGHVVPTRKAAWHEIVPAKELKNGRSPQHYYRRAKAFLESAAQAQRPFFLMANAQDPHRPFAGSVQEENAAKRDGQNKSHQYGGGFPDAMRLIRPQTAVVPGFLPDLPDVRQELGQYFTSVYRADQVTGAVLRALDESGQRDRTLVMFLSDHGMPLPFAKTNVWRNSTRTPWIIRWPGVVKPGSHDRTHLVSGIDLCPTILDAIGIHPLDGTDGKSFLNVLQGEVDTSRSDVFTHINTIASRRDFSMRSVQNARYGYIYNAWADGETRFKNESQSGLTFKAMAEAAKTNSAIAARVRHFVLRSREEFYDYERDPDALRNLIRDPQHADRIREFRKLMQTRMQESKDPKLGQFEKQVLAPPRFGQLGGA